MVMASTTFPPTPASAPSGAIASRIGGDGHHPAITRMMIESANPDEPRDQPDREPDGGREIATAKPTVNETRVPYSTRE
jgi:hypothetical protein